MRRKRTWSTTGILAAVMGAVACLSLAVCAVLGARSRALASQLAMQRQREMTDVADAMTDIETNLAKLLITSGAQQSARLLGETALLAQYVESGLARLPLQAETASGALKFAGQMGDYAMTLAAQVSGGSMLSGNDEQQISQLLAACQSLNTHLAGIGEEMYAQTSDAGRAAEEGAWQDKALGSGIEYPSLIYDGPFSDGRDESRALGLTGERVTREQARERAAYFAGTTTGRVKDAADSGGRFEAYGFAADGPDGRVSVQITGQGGHLLWMMPEEAGYTAGKTQEECVNNAQVWLADGGFGQMQPCFVQMYDGMAVINFASVQDGVLLYPDQVKVQVSLESGRVVGAECSQYLTNHRPREALEPKISEEEARGMLSSRLSLTGSRLCVIPDGEEEHLCWEFSGLFGGEEYRAYVDAETGEAAKILHIQRTQQGQMAV